jgi:hypothetical protein
MRVQRNGKAAGVQVPGEVAEPRQDTRTLWQLLPRLCWWVSSVLEEDAATPRLCGSLSFFYQDSGVKVCVRDRQEKRVAFVWAPSFEEAMLKAEKNLAAGTLDWRPDRYATGQ